MLDKLRPGLSGQLLGPVSGARIDDDHRRSAADRSQRLGQVEFLIKRENDDRERLHPHRVPHQ